MIATKHVALCFLVAVMPQEKSVDEGESTAAHPQSIQGTSVFSDGDPLAATELEFSLQRLGDSTKKGDRDSKPEVYRCQTNAEGGFELKLPSGDEYSATVVATKWIDGDRRRWRCSIPKVNSGMRGPLELVFENSGRIQIAFLGTANLAKDIEASISCCSSGVDDQVNIHRTIKPDSRRRLLIDGLEPGDYTIAVHVNQLRAESWKQTVTVPAVSPFRATAFIQFPEFKFGTFKAIVLLPDGKTPAANTHLFVCSVDENDSSFGSKELMTDSEGFVSARVSVGEIHLRYSADPRIDRLPAVAPALFRARVVTDELTDMGKLRLQAEDEVFAWMDGTIKHSDGNPVEKITPIGRLVGFSGAVPLIGMEHFFRPNRELEAGRFSMRVTAGKQIIAIGLEGTGQQLGGGFPIKVGDDKHLLMSVDLAAGSRIQRDIVLPIRKGDSSLKIKFDDSSPGSVLGFDGKVFSASVVNLLVEVAPGVVWRAEGRFENGFKVFEGVPFGECLVIVGSVFGNYFGSKTIAAESEQREIEFSQQEAGQLEIAIKDLKRLENKSLKIQMSINSPLQAIPVFSFSAEHPNLKRNSDGSILLEGIAPGAYQVKVGDSNLQREQNCVIESQKTTKIQF